MKLLATLSLIWTLLLTPQSVSNQSKVNFKRVPSAVSMQMNTFGNVIAVDESGKIYEIQIMPFFDKLGQLAKTDPALSAVLAEFIDEIFNPAGERVWP